MGGDVHDLQIQGVSCRFWKRCARSRATTPTTMTLSEHDTLDTLDFHNEYNCRNCRIHLHIARYCYRHNRQILDPNTIFRFTGLPNNAQLEMVACTKARSASNVTIGIQPEDGERILREFPPNTTLARALMEMYPDSDLERAVLIYMHREVCIHVYVYGTPAQCRN